MHRNQSGQVVVLEVDHCAEVVEAAESPEVHQEAEELLGRGDEEVLGEGQEEEVLMLGEVEGVIPILQGLAIGAEDHDLSNLALRQKALWSLRSTYLKKIPRVKILPTCTRIARFLGFSKVVLNFEK